MAQYIIDIETNGLLLDATVVWCAVAYDPASKQYHTFSQNNIPAFIELVNSADKVIGHNILMYDIPVLQRLYGLDVAVNKISDTLLVSRLLKPDREGGHSLAAWGNRFNSAKIDYTDFSKYTEEMLEYCKQDTLIAAKVYHSLCSEIQNYGKGVFRAIELEHKFAHIISKQIQAGFTLDVPKAEELYQELSEEYNTLEAIVKAQMPDLKDLTHYNTVVKAGRLISETQSNYTYVKGKNGKIETKDFKFIEPNPTSRQQIGDFLVSKGWKPSEYTETGQPKIDEKILSALPFPEAKHIGRLFRIQKQMGMIKDGDNGWLKCVRKDTGRVHGDVLTNATNTGRCSHARPNMAQVDKKDKRMRALWIPKDGWKLVGVDAASLELRMLAHYLYPYDKGAFAHEVVNGDVHSHNQKIMNLSKRDSAKSLIYALIYGGGNAKLGLLYYKDKDEYVTKHEQLARAGGQLRNLVNTSFTGYEKLCANVATAFKCRGFLVGIDGRPLHPRQEYSALNLLLQSAGALVMKQALINAYHMLSEAGYEHGVHYQFVGNIHDEVQSECLSSIAEDIGKLIVKAIVKAGQDFNLKCVLDGEYKIGDNWSETH